MGPFQRAAAVHRHRSPYLNAAHERFTALCRGYLTVILPKEVTSQPDLMESLDLLLSFELWSRLRREQGLSIKRARAIVEQMVRRLIGD